MSDKTIPKTTSPPGCATYKCVRPGMIWGTYFYDDGKTQHLIYCEPHAAMLVGDGIFAPDPLINDDPPPDPSRVPDDMHCPYCSEEMRLSAFLDHVGNEHPDREERLMDAVRRVVDEIEGRE